MNKRTFLKSLGAAAGALVLPTAVAAQVNSETPHSEETDYLGYRYHWTGLKPSQDNPFRVGQWLAWPLRGYGQKDVENREHFLYLNVPGFIGGPYMPGTCFNLTMRAGRMITSETPDETIEAWINEGEIYIRQLINAYTGKGQNDTHGYPMYQFPIEEIVVAPAWPKETFTFGFTGFTGGGRR